MFCATHLAACPSSVHPVALLVRAGSAARRLLSGAADRFKSMRQHIPRLGAPQGQGHGQAEGAEHASIAGASAPQTEAAVAGSPAPDVAGGSPPRDGPGSKEGQLGQRLSSGFRSLLGKAGGKPAGAAGAGAEAAGDADLGFALIVIGLVCRWLGRALPSNLASASLDASATSSCLA